MGPGLLPLGVRVAGHGDPGLGQAGHGQPRAVEAARPGRPPLVGLAQLRFGPADHRAGPGRDRGQAVGGGGVGGHQRGCRQRAGRRPASGAGCRCPPRQAGPRRGVHGHQGGRQRFDPESGAGSDDLPVGRGLLRRGAGRGDPQHVAAGGQPRRERRRPGRRPVRQDDDHQPPAARSGDLPGRSNLATGRTGAAGRAGLHLDHRAGHGPGQIRRGRARSRVGHQQHLPAGRRGSGRSDGGGQSADIDAEPRRPRPQCLAGVDRAADIRHRDRERKTAGAADADLRAGGHHHARRHAGAHVAVGVGGAVRAGQDNRRCSAARRDDRERSRR